MVQKYRPASVQVALMEFPEMGRTQVVARLTPDDKNDVDKAAIAMRMSQAEYVRLVLVSTTRKILAHYGAEENVSESPSDQNTSETPAAG